MEYCRGKNIQLGRLIGIGFDGTATFSDDKTGFQRRLKELSPHGISKKVERTLTSCIVCPLSLSCQLACASC